MPSLLFYDVLPHESLRAEVNYLRTTLDSLFENLKPEDAKITKIVVMIAEKDADREEKIESVTSEIGRHSDRRGTFGLLDVIVPPKEWYPPNLDNLTATFDDSPERMYWRTKQNLDHMYVMVYAYHFYGSSKYYLMLEDDVITVQGYISKILAFVNRIKRSWTACHFTNFEAIGNLFHFIDLPVIYNYILKRHATKPVDWLLKDCFKEEMRNPYRKQSVPALFQHVGKFSSLKGKRQNLRTNLKNFRRATDPQKTATSGNPGLLYTESSTNHGSGLLTDPYTSSGQFLLSSPHAGDFFLYHFRQDIRLLGLKVTLCHPLAKPLSVMVLPPLRFENKLKIKGNHEEIFWTKTTATEMEYVAEKDKVLKVCEVMLEVISDAETVCIDKIEVKF
ncbi:hypothetical protein L596_025158 [Steinernema carpocapsae]|uniref:MGAT4 conserved region domain-containing protein n=1 Tax=Steinernema carpocapsae TaxID=34508 RepID=A0A4U5M719_STECR|nr:hypothetical protein L596_025158 [Steinernema carpocapsae]